MKKQEIKNIFFMKDKKLIIVHMKGFDWDYKNYGIVYLCYREQRIKMDYTGFGNHEGNPTLSLKLNDSRYSSLNEIESEIMNNKNECFIER
ncbi:MAG: hypothetical protein JXP36_13920 [Bacteroidales bacterium]|nr:hypothetical protein [Bacteroidales bacterium]